MFQISLSPRGLHLICIKLLLLLDLQMMVRQRSLPHDNYMGTYLRHDYDMKQRKSLRNLDQVYLLT